MHVHTDPFTTGKSITSAESSLKEMELMARWKQPGFPLPSCPQIIIVLWYVTMRALAHRDARRDGYAW